MKCFIIGCTYFNKHIDLVAFPNAKINLGLNVVSKRPDGYHTIESCFYPVPWKDIVEIIPSKSVKFTFSGIDIPGSTEDNLCLQAYQILNEQFDLPPVHIHLHKVIPIGAGLGGGSADASFVLKMLNNKFQLGLNNEQLEGYAGQLGSDCPFFIQNKPVFATGTGNEFTSINIDLAGKFLVIAIPDLHISTKEAYSGVTPRLPNKSISAIIENYPIKDWQTLLHNDFEDSILSGHPEIEKIKSDFYSHGALYASMSGSGAAVYGIFEQPVAIEIKNAANKFSCLF